jgi:hypothetical protein
VSPMASLETAECKTFLGLQLDDDLLRAEFDAIITAEYPAPRPPRPTATNAVRAACPGVATATDAGTTVGVFRDADRGTRGSRPEPFTA